MCLSGSVIERVRLYSYELSYVHGQYVMSGGRVVTTLDSTVAEVTTRDGVRGYGEVCRCG